MNISLPHYAVMLFTNNTPFTLHAYQIKDIKRSHINVFMSITARSDGN